MQTVTFDGELTGADGSRMPVHCEVQTPFVGGQKARVRIAVPAQYLRETPPTSPCTLSGRNGATTLHLDGVHWRSFPTSSGEGTLALVEVGLLHIDRMTESYSWKSTSHELRIHLAPVEFLRKEANFVWPRDGSQSKELFSLVLPGIGSTRFVMEWATVFHHDAEIPGATVFAGFAAVVSSPVESPFNAAQIIEKFRASLVVLSVLFRQAVTLHGWTYAGPSGHSSTWIDPLEPNITTSGREERGDFVARPQIFVECATDLTQAYADADNKVKSLIRHLSVAVAPHLKMGTADRFTFMFSVFERVVEFAFGQDGGARCAARSDAALTKILERARREVLEAGGEDADVVAERLAGFDRMVRQPSVRSKLESCFREYPRMRDCTADLWPVIGSAGQRGLRDIRNALAHGRSSSVPSDVVTVATWHLGILLERIVFVLLDQPLPEGIVPRSFLLKLGGKGWYERDWWEPLRARPDRPI